MTSGYQISKKRPMGNNKVYAPPQGKYSSNLGSGKFLIATGLKKLSVTLKIRSFYNILEIKPFGLEFENSRCLFTEFAICATSKKFFFAERHFLGKTHRRRRSNSSLDL